MENISQEIINNLSVAPSVPYNPVMNHVWSYSDILQNFSGQFLDQVLRISLIFMFLELVCLWYVRSWDLPSWIHMNDVKDGQVMRNKVLQSVVYVCMVPAFYMPVLIVLYKLGVKI